MRIRSLCAVATFAALICAPLAGCNNTDANAAAQAASHTGYKGTWYNEQTGRTFWIASANALHSKDPRALNSLGDGTWIPTSDGVRLEYTINGTVTTLSATLKHDRLIIDGDPFVRIADYTGNWECTVPACVSPENPTTRLTIAENGTLHTSTGTDGTWAPMPDGQIQIDQSNGASQALGRMDHGEFYLVTQHGNPLPFKRVAES